MENTVKERLIKYLKYKCIGQVKFAETVGLSRGFVSNIVNSIQPNTLLKITKCYPDLNKGWLLTGEGEMLKENSENFSSNSIQEEPMGKFIPLLPVSAQGGSLNDFIVSVWESDCEKVVSPVRGADFAMTVSGDSMAPEYPNGSQVHVKKINEQAFIEWGKVYVVDTCNGAVIKRIIPSDREGYIKCVSINPNPVYAPFEIDMNDVYGIYRVMICLSIK